MPCSRNLIPVLIGAALVVGAVWHAAPCVAADEPATPARELAPPVPDLNGVWNLDTKASDDLKAFVKTLGSLVPSRGQRGEGGPGGGFGGRMPADELGAGAEGQEESPRGGQGPGGGPGSGLVKASQQLLISADGRTIEIVDGADRSETWVPDGETRKQEGPGGRAPSRRAVWQNGVLVLEQLGGPFSLTRRLQLSDDGRRLLVDLSVLDANGKPVTAHLEYAGVD